MHRVPESKIDTSQKVILPKLIQYLKLCKESKDEKKKPLYDPNIIDKLITKLSGKGYCAGFTGVASYALWLQFQPKNVDNDGNPIERDDWSWYKSTLDAMATWNGKSLPAASIMNNIDRLLSLFEFFQNVHAYLPLNQPDLDQMMEDTHGRKPTKEYSLAGLLTQENLITILPKILFDDRIIYISSPNHVISLFRHEDTIFFYNSSDPSGMRAYNKTNQLQNVATAIFNANGFVSEIPSPLGFKVFSFDKTQPPPPYPMHSSMLANTPVSRPMDKYAMDVTALIMAVHMGCLESLKFHIRNLTPEDVNRSDLNGDTPVLVAAEFNQPEALELLIQKGANVNHKNNNETTPLYMAAAYDHVEILKLLLSNGAEASTPSIKNFSPSHVAAFQNNAAILDILGKNHADLNQMDKTDGAPIHLAAAMNNVEALRVLVKLKANVNLVDKQGLSPAYLAAQAGHVAALRVLAGNKFGLLKSSINPMVDPMLYDKDTIILHNGILYYAIHDTQELITLIRNDSNKEKYDALKLACNNTYKEASCDQMQLIASIIGRIPESHASQILDIPINTRLKFLLEHAKLTHREKEVNELFTKTKGAEIDVIEGFTALHAAIFYGHIEAVKELIAMNFDIHKTTKENISGLELAEAMNQTEIIKLLRETMLRQESTREVKIHIDKSAYTQDTLFSHEVKENKQPDAPNPTGVSGHVRK